MFFFVLGLEPEPKRQHGTIRVVGYVAEMSLVAFVAEAVFHILKLRIYHGTLYTTSGLCDSSRLY